jgi:serine/threonine protein kinase
VAKVIKFGEPENESERLAIQYLKGHLPDNYRLYTNLEIPRGRQLYEVDLIVVAPHAVYIVDVKGVYGRVEVDDNDWYPENRQPYPSPLKKYRQHVRALAGLIKDANPAHKHQVKRILIQAVVLLTTDDVEIIDVSRNSDQAKDIVRLGEPCIRYFKDWQSIDSYDYDTQIAPYLSTIDRAIRGRSQPSNRKKRFGSWEVIEKLGEKEGKYIEYLAKKVTVGLSNRTARLRVYFVDPWLDTAEREEAYRLISRAFEAVDDLPNHDNILEVQDIFEADDAEGLVLVTEDVKGKSLRQLVRTQELTLEQKLNIMGDVLRALDHAHKHEVIHRNVTPDNIFVTPEKQAKLTGFDYARLENRTGTIADAIRDELQDSSVYQDFDCQRDPSKACGQSDLFSAGQVFYELLMGVPAFTSLEGMVEQSGIFKIKPSQKHPDLPRGFDAWLQKLCAFDRQDRFQDAREALDKLTPLSKVVPDLANLPPETLLNNQYMIVERLGKPGSFAVAYKVLYTYTEDFQVMKVAIRDRYSLFERVQQEFKALYQVLRNPHPHIVTARWPGELHEYDNTPFLIFEYVDGQDLEEWLASEDLSLEQSLKIVQETASGLAHLHNNGIFHQDIKPSNLLITGQGVKIIDFNVAVTTADESTITAGTRRYLPPDFKPSPEPSHAERIDRDLYALGITAYECITGHYPFDAAQPMVGVECIDPRQFDGCEDLSEEVVQFLRKALAPQRPERFQSAQALLEAVDAVRNPQPATLLVEPEPTDSEPQQEVEIEVEAVEEPADEEPAPAVIQQPEQPAEPIPAVVIPITPPVPVAAEALPVKPSPFNLFDPLPREHQALPNTSKPIVLDPSKAYTPPQEYITIENEVDWMQRFQSNGSPFWVRGESLCKWAEEWLRCWNRSHLIAEVKQPPREKLATWLEPASVPSEWTEQQCLAVVTRLEKYPVSDPIAYLLADITESDIQVWLGQPSRENLAQWLAIRVPEEAVPLEKAWQAKRPHSSLNSYYQTTDKLQLLRQWLGIAEPKPVELGAYPFDDVPPILQAEFDNFWEREFYRSNFSVLDDLDLARQSASQRIAARAYEVLKESPGFITTLREKQLKGYIGFDQYQDLTQRHRPPEPQPLPLDASPKDALSWVTEGYLPLRRWETVVANLPKEKQVCDPLATSFEAWMLEHYPSLTVDSVASSWLNYNVCHQVEELVAQGPVFWVVVDGLGWLDHQALLAMLTEKQGLQLEQGQTPRFSILPTKTEYAKWSLYSQRPPSHESWVPDAGKGFAVANGKRYTDNDETKGRLQKDIAAGKLQLYCWDTDRFDSLFHKEVDWQNLYTVKRQRVLRDIADDILRFVDLHPQKDTLQVVIASDHGQLMGISDKLANIPEGIEPKGRMAIGKAEHPHLAVLDQARFELPHDISVIRGPSSFSSFSYGDDKSIIGCHGGLYPEEVVVGFSVLKRSVKRAPVIAKCYGEGRPGESSIFKIEIYNPNPLVLEDLKITVPQLGALQSGKALEGRVEPRNTRLIEVPIPKWPELPPSHEGKFLSLTGELEFRYHSAELASVELDKDSAIEVSQIFSSGIEGLDDFL